MAWEVGAIVAKLKLDKAGFSDGLKSAEKSLDKFGKGLSTVGKKMTIGLTLPLVGIGSAAIKMATDAIESENLFEVSMKGMADSARKWSEKLRNELGLNSYEVRENVATFQTMFRSLGIGEKSAYDMSTALTELAYDMASFRNLKPEDAFLKLQAAITGEVEPLKRLGVVVNETAIKHWALTNGLIKQNEQMTEQQKVWARFNVIMERTTDMQGDLKRTLDSTANKVRILKSRTTELTIDMGLKLLPTFEKFIKKAEEGVDWFGRLSDSEKDLIVKGGMLGAVMGPLVYSFGKLLTILPKLITPLGLISTGLITIAAGAKRARDGFKDMGDAIKDMEQLTGKKMSWLEKAYYKVENAVSKVTLGTDKARLVQAKYNEELES